MCKELSYCAYILELKLGDMCSNNFECESGVNNSHCADGMCICKPSFIQVDGLCEHGMYVLGFFNFQY